MKTTKNTSKKTIMHHVKGRIKAKVVGTDNVFRKNIY